MTLTSTVLVTLVSVSVSVVVIIGTGLLSLTMTVTANPIQSNPIDIHDDSNHRQGRLFMEFAKIVHEILNFKKSKFAIGCNTCVFALEMLKGMIDENRTVDDIVDVASSLCVSLGIADQPVCRGMLDDVTDELIYVYKHMNHTVENVCAFVLGPICMGEPFMNEFDWSVSLTSEPVYHPPTKPHPDAPKLRILHISDVHLDRQYEEDTVANCDQPLCCHHWSTSKSPNISKAGHWGDTGGVCDMPSRTIENFLEFVTNNVKYDVVYWTGDIPAHDIWNQTKSGILDDLRHTADLFKRYFGDTPVYPCLGNHESQPINSFPVPKVYNDYDISYLYDTLVSTWSDLVPEIDDISTIRRGAYYSALVKPQLRLISLNMNYCNNQNWWLLVDSKDPTSEIEWLVEQLDLAENNNEKVHIIGHIPPGNFDCAYVWSRNLHNVTLRYKNTITGQFYGHTHKDDYSITYDNSDRPRPVAMNSIGPSVTTFDGVNPAFRVYTVDGVHKHSSYSILDHDTYYMDLNAANAGADPDWKIFYSALDAYGLDSYSPLEWDKLVSRMAVNETLFKVYLKNYYRGIDHGPCNAVCKARFLCSIRTGWSGANCQTKR